MRFLIILSVLVLASCTKKEAEPTEVEAAGTQAPAEAEAPSEAPAPAEAPPTDEAEWKSWGEEGVATLITPGKAPLRTLRRTFKKGSRAKVDLEVTALGEAEEGEEALYVGARYLVTLETKTVADDGSKASVGLTVEGASPIGQDADPGASANFARLEGLSGSYTVDALGTITDFELEAPKDPARQTAGAVDNLKRLQALLSIPLPKAEVGVGAQWSVFSTLDEPRPIAQRTTYEITKAKGSKVEVRAKVELMNKTVDLEGAIKLLGTTGTGTGAVSFDLASLTPKSAQLDTKRTLFFFAVDTGEKHDVDLDLSAKLTAK
jgi:hypothetical protein